MIMATPKTKDVVFAEVAESLKDAEVGDIITYAHPDINHMEFEDREEKVVGTMTIRFVGSEIKSFVRVLSFRRCEDVVKKKATKKKKVEEEVQDEEA